MSVSKPIKINTNDEDFWVHMSVLEIRAQAQFAKMTYKNIKKKLGTGDEWAVFSSIHSFLSHCAMISKMLQAKGPTRSIEQVLDFPANSIINFYDSFTRIFTFVDEDFDLAALFEETRRIMTVSSKWLNMEEPKS